MRLTAWFLAHEMRIQLRSPRFWIAAALYLALCTAPAVVVFVYQRHTAHRFGAATYVAEVATVLPAATALLALLLASDGILRERGSGVWSALTAAPLSNAGYLLRRWLAVAVVVAAWSLAPLAAALALAAAAAAPAADWSVVALPWAIQVLPVAAGGTALSLGMCTLADGVVPGAVQAALALWLIPAGLNRLLAPLGRHQATAWSWLGGDRLIQRLGIYRLALAGVGRPVVAVSEGGYDAVVAGQWLSAAAPTVALGLAALAAATVFLHRGQRDLRPWRIPPAHPLGNFLRLLNRLRPRYSPDPAPGAAERLALAAGAALLALALAGFAWRDAHFRALARTRYAAEVSGWPGPTAADVVPERCVLRAALTADGGVESRVALAVRNAGSAPRWRLAFALNPGLRLLRLAADRGSAAAERRWDRLEVRLAPPLAAGEARRLDFDLAGRPAAVHFNLPAAELSFFAAWSQLLTRRFAHDLTDLAASYEVRAVSPRRIALAAADLAPLPRFTTWALVPAGTPTARVPDEQLAREVDLAIEITAPPGVFLADSCGDRTDAAGRLRGSCRTALVDFTVRGAHAAPLALAGTGTGEGGTGTGGGPTFALLPQHQALGRAYAASLRGLAAALPRAWPGLAPPGPPVLLEWSPEFSVNALEDTTQLQTWGRWFRAIRPLEVHGALVLVPESLVADGAPLRGEAVVGELTAAALLRRRPVVDGQQFVFRALLRALVEQRLGYGPPTGAVLELERWQVFPHELTLLERGDWIYAGWPARLAALAADLAARVGEGSIERGLDTFLARPGRPGTIEELLHDFEAASGVSLAGFYRDYVSGRALPELTLAGVVERRRGALWVVTGRVENRASGEAVCPVLLNTDQGSVGAVVRIPGERHAAAAFTLVTPDRPQSVELDPQNTCHRLRPSTPGAIAEYVGLQGDAS